MKALGLIVSVKKIFESCILKTYFLTLWPTYATNWNGLNNFDRGPHRNHSCEVSSKSNEWFRGRRCLSKTVYARRTTTDDGQRPVTIAHHEHFVLRWAKNTYFKQYICNFYSKTSNEGDTPSPLAYCVPPYFGLAYCVLPFFGLAYCVLFNNKNNHFGRLHLHKEDKMTVCPCTCTIILENIGFDVYAC